MATGEENEIGGGYEDEPVDPEIDEDAEPKENLNDDVPDPVLDIRLEDEEEGEGLEEGNISEDLSGPVKAEEESAELEKEDLCPDPVDPSSQNRAEADKDPDWYATYHYATINSVLSSDALSRLAQRIEKSKNAVFLRTAEEVLKSLEDWLLKSPPVDLIVPVFSGKMYGVWEDTCFVNDLRLTIEEVSHDLTWDFLNMSKKDSPEDRVNCMKFDSCLKTGLKEIELNNTNQFPTAITIRLFLNILVAHWTDEEVLTGLEKKMGKDHFKETSQWIAERKAKVIAFNKQNVQWEHLTLTVKSIERAAEAVEDLRNVLIGKYGVENQNIEATLKRVKGQLNVILSVHNKHYGYDGGEVTFLLRGYDGRYDISSVVEE